MNKKGQIVPFGFMRKASGGSSTISGHPTLSTGLVHYYKFDTDANDSVGTNHGTVSGATLTTGSGGKINEAYDYDGVNDRTVINDVFVTTNTSSWFGWVNLDALGWQALVVNGTRSSDRSWEFVLAAGKLRYALATAGGSWAWVEDTVSATLLTANTWHHVGFTRNGTTLTIYVDGSSVSTSTIAGSASSSVARTPSNGKCTFANDQGTFWGDGTIDESGFWDKELTSSEVTDLYNGGSGLPYN